MTRPDSYDQSVYQSRIPRPVPVTAASRAAQQRPPRVVERWLTAQAIAAELGVSKMTVYRLIHTAVLPAKRIGRSLRVSETALTEFLRTARADDVTEDER